MPHCRSTTLGLVALVVLSACGSRADRAGPVVGITSTLPDEVNATCTPQGITVDVHEVQTRPGGVALRINSSLPRGSYLTYTSAGNGGASGGDAIAPGRQSWTLRLAPGVATLGCDPVDHTGKGTTTTVKVTDAGRYWRGTRDVDAAGCSGSGLVDWVLGFTDHADSAPSAAQAVARLFQASSLRTGQSDRFTTRPLAVGYVGDSAQTWLLLKSGKPYATIAVHRTENGSYDAGPDASCQSR